MKWESKVSKAWLLFHLPVLDVENHALIVFLIGDVSTLSILPLDACVPAADAVVSRF